MTSLSNGCRPSPYSSVKISFAYDGETVFTTSENKIPLPSIYFLEEIHLPTKETLNKYQIKPLKNTNFLNYIYVNYAKKALKSMNNVSVPKNSLGTGTLKILII